MEEKRYNPSRQEEFSLLHIMDRQWIKSLLPKKTTPTEFELRFKKAFSKHCMEGHHELIKTN